MGLFLGLTNKVLHPKLRLILLFVILSTSATQADTITLSGTIRDFSDSHSDMQNGSHKITPFIDGDIYSVIGLVESTIGSNRNPIFKNTDGTIKGVRGDEPQHGLTKYTITSKASFDEWFNDVAGVNQALPYDLVLDRVNPASNTFIFDSDITPTGNGNSPDGFFPIDGQFYGDEGRSHNYHFSYEIHSRFTYKGGETFTFRGDDDVWVFIDDKLAIDAGGIHFPVKESIDLDTLGLTVGNTYSFDFFFAERATRGSNLKIETSIHFGECKANPKIVFIIDDSGSIDDTERAEMTIGIQKITDKFQVSYPNAEFGIVHYGTPLASLLAEDGTYDIVMGYTTNPTINLPKNAALTRDHLPDSIDQMITDNIFSTGGVLADPDAFFIFTDASRKSGGCCSVLDNGSGPIPGPGFPSADAEPGFGEYSKLAALSSTGNVSLYQVAPFSGDASPEIVQGNGVHQIGNFALAQSSIDSIADSLCAKEKVSIEQCYAITDDNTSLYKFDLDPSTPPTSVNMSRLFNGEALAYRATNDALYAFHQTVAPTSTAPSDLYKIELDGTDTLIATDFLDSRASGAEFISYSDGTEQLVVLMREKDSKIQFFDATDLPSKTPLKTLDLTYPDGSDVEHMDGLAVNPTTGEMLIMKSHSPDDIDPEIYSVNTNTGVITHKVTLVVTTPEIDAESFAFSSDGNAYTETEKGQHRIFRINLTTGALTEVEKANLSDDIEGMACIGSTIKTPPPIQRCPSGITPVVNGLKIGVPNSPWPGDPSITYTLTATNYQATNPNINAYRPPGQGILRGAKDGDQAHKQNSSLPTTLNIKLSQPVPAHQFYFYAQDIETQMGDDNVGTLKIISGTATPADFMQGSWSGIKAPGAYNPLTGKVTMTNMGDTSKGDQGMFFLLGETLATVQELEISTGSYLSAGDYVGHILTNIGCTIPSISGSVFNDDNTNDIFDAAESGLADIKVWVQAINADGTLDPTKVLGSTDAQGGYIFPSLVDGDYQVHVDTTDVDIPIDRVLGGINPLVVTVTSSGVRDVDFPFDQVVCTAFSGEVSEVSLPISSQLKTTDKIFVPSRSISPIEGHLRAYSVGSNGKASTTIDWDAATRMSKGGRTSKLYSTGVSGGSVLFKSLDNAAFGSTGALTVANIKAYTIDPSTSSGKYLAGRKDGSYLGGISKGNNVEILSNSINTSLYLHDVTYRTFYTSTISSRNKRVLMNSDDGFLYSFDYETGDLVWAWMPRSLASDLSDFSAFQKRHLMAGSVEVLDLKDSSGVYATYIVGSYKNGLGHYVLKLSDTGALQSVVWDDDQSSTFVSSPDAGAMDFFSDDDGQVFAAYAVTNNLSTSQLKIRSLTDAAVNITANLNYEVTSVPFVMQNYGKSNAPDKKTIYIGTSVGNIHSAVLLDKSGSLVSSDSIKAEIESKSVAEMYVVDTEAVTHIDSSISIKDNRYYLVTQTDKRLTTHLYLSSTGTWRRAWTSAISSAGEWDNASIYTEASVGSSAAGIQSLPVGTTVTDKAVVVGDIVFLPISVLDPSAAACYGKAYYFLYNLSNGSFPKSFKPDETGPMMGMGLGEVPDGDGVGDNIKLGYGEAKRLTFTDIAGSNNLLVGYGVADKRLDLTAGIATSFNIKNPVGSGLRAWKEIGR